MIIHQPVNAKILIKCINYIKKRKIAWNEISERNNDIKFQINSYIHKQSGYIQKILLNDVVAGKCRGVIRTPVDKSFRRHKKKMRVFITNIR